MIDNRRRFYLYCDTSKFAIGSALYQIKNKQSMLIAYASKRMSTAAQNYSMTELELYGLAHDTATFSHLLKTVDFDAVVHHLALTHNMKSKLEQTTKWIKRLLEILSSHIYSL